jgi:hypothetical protein
LNTTVAVKRERKVDHVKFVVIRDWDEAGPDSRSAGTETCAAQWLASDLDFYSSF